jgi:hypothetical protein
MAHDSTFQEMPERQSEQPATGALRSEPDDHDRVPGPDMVDRAPAADAATTAGTASVALGVSGLPDRDSLQESGAPGTADLGARLQRADGLGGTRGDDQSFNNLPGQVSGVGGTTGSGAGTGSLEGKTG